MDKKKQSLIFGLEDENLKMALERKYSIPFIFEGTKSEKKELSKIVKKNGFYEYFNTKTGKAYGAKNFSWTASLFLDLILEKKYN